VEVEGGTLLGGQVTVRGEESSQFLSGLLLAAPAMPLGLVARLEGPLVSRPYVDLTGAVMDRFGVAVERPDDYTWVVGAQPYAAADVEIEPDASAASYVFATAVLTDGRVEVAGLAAGSQQGDLGFVDLLERMGASVVRGDTSVSVTGTGRLRGIEANMAQISDTAQTLAVVAAFADGPTTVTGIGFIRGKETNRVAAVVAELQRLGVDASEDPDGFTVRPGPMRPAVVRTYDDHRMAMAFALAGLRSPGVSIEDPGCVVKTFPGYWRLLDELRTPSGPGTMVHRS
jgi:3-phosphoshikimate 1-carboxyvinyltransferase